MVYIFFFVINMVYIKRNIILLSQFLFLLINYLISIWRFVYISKSMISETKSKQERNKRDMENKGSKRCCIVLVPGPLQGHITPMLQLGSMLHSKGGFSVIVAHAEYNSPNTKDHPEFVFASLPDNASGHSNITVFLTAININCKAPLEEYLVQIQGEVACIIYDSIMYFTDAVANHLKLPSIVMRSASAAFLESARTVLRLQAQNCLPLPESQLDKTIPELHPFRFKDMPLPVTSCIPEDLVQLWDIVTDIKSSRAMIWNTSDELEYSLISKLQQQYQVPFFCIGPFHKMAPTSRTSLLEEDRSCIAWLDKQTPNSVLYVSLGSLASMDEKELIETAWGLVKSDQPFLWVVRSNSVSSSKWLEELPQNFQELVAKRGRIVTWAPQKEVLQHSAVGGFWSHCGWNSTIESISQGIPMICKPFFSDQMLNSRYLTHVWNIGLEMESTLERGVIEKTVRKLMVEPKGKEMKKRVVEMKRRLEICVEKGGSSNNSLDELIEFISSLSLNK